MKTRPTVLVTFNVRGIQTGGVPFRERMHILFEYLKRTPVDELHLQEVYTYGMLRYLKYHIGSALPYATYSKGLLGPKAGIVSFYRDKPTEVGFYWLPGSVAARTDLLGVVPYIHKGVLRTKTATDEWRFNLHLDPDHSGEWKESSSSMRLITRQLAIVSGIVTEHVATTGSPFAVVGDFNLPAGTASYNQFVDRIGAVDVLQDNPRPTFHKEFLSPGKVPRQIDHVLTWPRVHAVGAELVLDCPVGRVFASDHLGILATLNK